MNIVASRSEYGEKKSSVVMSTKLHSDIDEIVNYSRKQASKDAISMTSLIECSVSLVIAMGRYTDIFSWEDVYTKDMLIETVSKIIKAIQTKEMEEKIL